MGKSGMRGSGGAWTDGGAARRAAMVALGALALITLGCGGDTSGADETAETLDAALTAHAEGRIDDATKDYEKVLEEDPDNQFAHYNLGLLDQQAGRLQQAEERYRAALRTDPNFTSALFNLAIIRTSSDPEEAEHLYRSVIRIEPDNASAHLNLGFLLIDGGEQARGEAALQRAVELDPSLAARVPEREADDDPDEPAESTTTTTTGTSTTEAP